MRPSLRLRAQASWALAGTLAGAAASLAGVRLITLWVPAGAFGEASLILGLVALVSGLVIGPIGSACQRIYFDYSARGMSAWFQGQFDRLLLAGVAFCVLLYVVAAWATNRRAGLLVGTVLAGCVLVGQTLQTRLSIGLEVRREQKSLAAVSTLNKALVPVALLILMVMGVDAAIAVILSQAAPAVLIGLAWRLPDEAATQRFVPESHRKGVEGFRTSLVSVGWALPVSWLAMWGVTTSSRYVLDRYLTADAVGIYAMNTGLWITLFSLLNGWLETFTRPILYAFAAAGDTRGVWGVTIRRCLVCAGGLGLVLAMLPLVGWRLVHRFLGPNYATGGWTGLMIVAGAGMQATGYALVSALLAVKRVPLIAAATVAAAAVNLGVCLAAVPLRGVTGAAIGSVLAGATWNALLGVLVWTTLRNPASMLRESSKTS